MMFLVIVILSLNINLSFKLKNLNTYHFINIYMSKNDKSIDGYDHRFPINPNKSEDEAKLYNISLSFKKKNILHLLTDEKVSMYTKNGILRENIIYLPNILAGGLMKEFDFPPF
jgi:hypothetical protein